MYLQTRNALSDLPQWEQYDREFNNQLFFWNIVEFFDGGYGKEILDHFNR